MMRKSFDPANLRDWGKILPDLAQLIWKIVRDQRVPTYVRGGLVGIGAYLVLPIDVVPDWLPFAGQIDDLLVTTIGLRMLLRRVPVDILLEHWTGNRDTLEGLLAADLRPQLPDTTA